MKSIKPGRGPSAIGVWGSVIAIVFGIIWTVAVSGSGAPGFFPLFGVLFIITGIINGIYNYKNATGKNRYSAFDITDEGEEPDPFAIRVEQRYRDGAPGDFTASGPRTTQTRFCPYCGAGLQEDFQFCPKCGRQLP